MFSAEKRKSPAISKNLILDFSDQKGTLILMSPEQTEILPFDNSRRIEEHGIAGLEHRQNILGLTGRKAKTLVANRLGLNMFAAKHFARFASILTVLEIVKAPFGIGGAMCNPRQIVLLLRDKRENMTNDRFSRYDHSAISIRKRNRFPLRFFLERGKSKRRGDMIQKLLQSVGENSRSSDRR
jgi:hypothetical protein